MNVKKRNVKASIVLEVEFLFNIDLENEDLSIDSVKLKSVRMQGKKEDETTIHTLTETQVKFGILTLGAKSSVGKVMPLGEEIIIDYYGEKITAKTHRTVKGRIDGLTRFYLSHPELKPDTKITALFDSEGKVLKIKRYEGQD
ncbi:hypothetical protein SAMN05660826_01767 [Caldanaerovirga acetigignens]|uniref:Uncharacterized protein n=1 Tax=Caldanaerovirga acetigignens TaxID=447595 RepID=A0A1M7L2Q6_9FIRM|nr:hypothetical protein [Caldanaerovirga acetigignens]SHM72160.1 hypothetical protein SAMN05660826_01767 [Caldanaerovirga acetigignens]